MAEEEGVGARVEDKLNASRKEVHELKTSRSD